jgi:hypothetical protein
MMWSVKSGILVNFSSNNEPRCVRRTAKPLGLQQLAVSEQGTPAQGEWITDEVTHRFRWTSHFSLRRDVSMPSLSCIFSYPIDVCRPGQLRFEGHSEITYFDRRYQMSQKIQTQGLWIRRRHREVESLCKSEEDHNRKLQSKCLDIATSANTFGKGNWLGREWGWEEIGSI